MKYNTIKKLIGKHKKLKNNMPKKVANIAVNHFKESFIDGGFTDSNLKAWKQRKNPDRGRAILVKSGTLRRAFKKRVTVKEILITNSTPYARRHNRGLNGMPKRQFMGKSVVMVKRIKQEYWKELIQMIKV